jgi:hypothetical protein
MDKGRSQGIVLCFWGAKNFLSKKCQSFAIFIFIFILILIQMLRNIILLLAQQMGFQDFLAHQKLVRYPNLQPALLALSSYVPPYFIQ